jgi:hypothetical protein
MDDMRSAILSSMVERFPYSSTDVAEPQSGDHPQVKYADYNKIDPHQVEKFSSELERLAHQWASSSTVDPCSEFAQAVYNLRSMLNATSATIMVVQHLDGLLVERPGMSDEKDLFSNRRKEISALTESILGCWSKTSAEERLSFSRLALLGLAPLQAEIINYSDTADAPRILGRMLSRLDQLSRNNKCENLGAVESLRSFHSIEQEILVAAGLTRICIPVGTRPRIYLPIDAVAPDEHIALAASEMLNKGGDKADVMVRFLSMVWKEFSDEGFVALHEGNEVNAYAIVGGCCYYYHADICYTGGQPSVKSDHKPYFLATAGEFTPTNWRRNFDKLPFENATEGLREFRRDIISLECLSEEERRQHGSTGRIMLAAQKLLNRQINYNISHVLRGQMERMSSDEWSPNMCRDKHGRIYNPPHALGGVGEMFRGLLQYGGRSSQFRTWREADGTHGFEDMRRFLGYKKSLDTRLSS